METNKIIEQSTTLIGKTLTQEELKSFDSSVQSTSTLDVLEQMACNLYCVEQVTRTRTHHYAACEDSLLIDFKDGDCTEIFSAFIE